MFKINHDRRLPLQEDDEDHQTFPAEKHLRDQANYDNNRNPAAIEIENIHPLTDCFHAEDAVPFKSKELQLKDMFKDAINHETVFASQNQ